MVEFRALLMSLVCLLLVAPVAHADTATPADASQRSVAYQWVDVALASTKREVVRTGARPTVLSRTLAIFSTAMYDAWAAYDDQAVGTRLGGSLRRPAEERTLANREKAIAFAAYRSLVEVYPADAAVFAQEMRNRGFDPNDTSTDLSTPQGVGNVAAAALIAYRRADGSNQQNGYADTSGYQPVNSEFAVIDPDRWQPLPFLDAATGNTFYPGFLTPHWGAVKPFALESGSQFRPPPPPLVGSKQLEREVDEVIDFNATLSLEEKGLVEYMRDGPLSTGQAGHWLLLSQFVSQRDNHTLEQDVKMFFTVGNVAMDAFIAAWDTKRFYDSSRPWTLVRYLNEGKQIKGWFGPGLGAGHIDGAQWLPYSPLTFVTPPFPGYVSGHSAISGAAGRVLELFVGSDTFGLVEPVSVGELTEPGYDCSTIMSRYGKPSKNANGDCQINVVLNTFSETAELAGISRVMGGYHIQADNIEGLKLGRNVANYSWLKIQTYFNGTAR